MNKVTLADGLCFALANHTTHDTKKAQDAKDQAPSAKHKSKEQTTKHKAQGFGKAHT